MTQDVGIEGMTGTARGPALRRALDLVGLGLDVATRVLFAQIGIPAGRDYCVYVAAWCADRVQRRAPLVRGAQKRAPRVRRTASNTRDRETS